MSDEAGLVRRAQAGDVRAFRELYETHHSRVHRTARWLLGTDDVDDAVQDVFVRAWTKLSSFRAEAAFGAWLHRVATNQILRHRERSARWQERTEQLDTGTHEAPRDTPDERMDLEDAVSTLPDGARTVFVLYDVQGFGHAEIAEMLGVTEPTSRSQLHRARMLLRQYIGEESGC